MADEDEFTNDQEDLEYVERITNSFTGKEATAESVALSKYRKILVIDNKIRDRKTQHLAELRRFNTKINRLSRQIGRMRLRAQKATKSNSAANDPNPEGEDELDDGDENDEEAGVEDLETELEATIAERDSATTLCEADIDAFATDLPVLLPHEKIIVRGFVALEKEKKLATLRNMRRRSSKGMEAAKMKRYTNLQFAEFFSKRNGQQFDELLHDEMSELVEHYRQADFNESGGFEEDDFIKLVQKLMCDHGITTAEIDRVGILCDVSILDGFVLNLRQFFDFMFLLLPALGDAESRIKRSADESLDGLRLRQGLAAKDANRKFEIEKLRRRKSLSIIAAPDTPEQLQRREEQARHLKMMRVDWARTAVILTHQELERIRALKLKSGFAGNASAPPSALADKRKPSTVQVADPSDEGQSRAKAPPAYRRVAPPPQPEGSSSQKQASSAARELDKYRSSVKTALERAPFPEPRADGGSRQAAEQLSAMQLDQFRTLFNVLSEQQPVIDASHIHHLLELFTPCGSDESEAESFLKDDCRGQVKGLTFEQFLEFGNQLRARVFAFSVFDALPTERAKVQAVVERTGNLRRSKPLWRFERVFMRQHLAQQKERQEKHHVERVAPQPLPPQTASSRSKWLPQPPASSTADRVKAKPQSEQCRPGTAPNDPSTTALALPIATPSSHQVPPQSSSRRRNGRLAGSARPRAIATEQRVPLPSPRSPNADFQRFDLHACRLEQDYQLVTDLRSMYLI